MSHTGVRVECLRAQGQVAGCRDPIFTSPPVWVEELATAGEASHTVPAGLATVYGTAPQYILRVTAYEDAYVLSGQTVLAPTELNGVLVQATKQLLIAAAPGDKFAWAAA